MNKVIRNGKVAVLVSHGYGTGWSTWNSSLECLFSPEVVAWVAEGKDIDGIACPKVFGDAFYYGGADGLQIHWVEEGQQFYIIENDGYEIIQFNDDVPWITA